MTRRIALLVVGLAAIGVLVWWYGRPSRAERFAAPVATSEQQRLWREVAAKNLAPGLDRIPVPGSPIQNPPQPLPPSRPAARGSSALPSGAATAIQLVRVSPGGSLSYSGKAKVKAIDPQAQRIDLDVAGRTLTFLARLGGKALPLTTDQVIDVEYRVERGSTGTETVLAVDVDRSTAIAAILKTGPSRVTVRVDLLDLTLQQPDKVQPQNGAMPVRATVRTASETIEPGKPTPRQVGDVLIRLEGSLAPPAGAPRTDGSAYAIDAVAWRAPGPRQ